jgi:hypothetical protein
MTQDVIRKRIEKAGRRAVEFRRKGFHCSESTFLAINETLGITSPDMVRIVTGFHGGGGSHRKEPGVNLNAVLEELASGRDRRPIEDLPIEVTGHLCGALASGVICVGFLYGRRSPTDDLTCVDELAFELHRRFISEFGEKECRPLREKFVPESPNHTCEHIYKRGAEIAVEVILNAPHLISQCAAIKGIHQGI